MARKIPVLALLLGLMLGCQKWYLRTASPDYAQYGWQQTYESGCPKGYLIISLGQNDKGAEIIAIDYLFFANRLRLYGQLLPGQYYDLELMKFSSEQSVYLNLKEKEEFWKHCGLRTLYWRNFFKKLPEPDRKKVLKLLGQAEIKYGSRYQR